MANTDASSDDTDAVFPASSGGGVFPSRPAHYENLLQRKFTNDPKTADVELASVTEGADYDERDFHKKQVSDGVNVFLQDTDGPQVFSGWTLAWFVTYCLIPPIHNVEF
jgi:hypothetical protein